MSGFGCAIAIAAAVASQKAPGVEQVLKPKLTLVEQNEARRNQLDTWIIDEFVFIPPRMILVDVPAKGRRLLWYMVYRVTNRSSKPRFLMLDFVLVDDKGKAYHDAIIPKAQRLIQLRESPLQPLENSVTIAGLIEPSTEEGVDKSKYGVAIWDGIDLRLQRFDIFVVGLSNAYRKIKDPATGKELLQRKTLRLKFSRPGDEFYPNEREIHYEGHEWIYR